MPSTSIYLDGYLEMPNGQHLWAEDIDLEVEYEIHKGYDDPRLCDVDYSVVGISGPVIASDDFGNEVVLNIPADHPAIRKLVRKCSHVIEDACIDDASFQ